MNSLMLNQLAPFLKDWELSGEFGYQSSLRARLGLLRGLEDESIKIFGWNEKGDLTGHEGHEEYINWLLNVAQFYLGKVCAVRHNQQMVEQELWLKALIMAVKALPKLMHFSFHPDAYVRVLKFISDERIYPEFLKDQYAREVRNLLVECDGIAASSCRIDDPEQIKAKAEWKDKYYPNRLYWYAAVISSNNFNLVSQSHEENLMVLLKLRLHDYFCSKVAQERGHKTAGDMLTHRYPGDHHLRCLQELTQIMLKQGQLDQLTML